MDLLLQWIEASQIPALTAFLLGLLTAISPCPLASNITAVGYIGKEIDHRSRAFLNGLWYTLGRIFTYTLLGFILIPLLKKGVWIYAIQNFLSRYGEGILGPFLILIGLIMLYGHKLKIPAIGIKRGGEKLKLGSSVGSFLLGCLFALAFCPTSGFFFFGMLIPMSVASAGGYALPLIYAFATGLPVIAAAWILAFSVGELGKFYRSMQSVRKWMNLIIALIFLGIGLYYTLTILL